MIAGASWQTTAVDWAANCGSISVTCTKRDQVGGEGRAVFQRMRIQNVYCAGAGVKVEIVTGGKVHGRFSAAIVKIEIPSPNRGKRAICINPLGI